MNAIKKARRLIKADPTSASAITLANLVRALESDEVFALGDLYKLGFDDFNLGLEVLKEWRLDRYYMSKGKLIDVAVQVHQLN